MTALTRPLALISLLLASALFGFFYAWVCSTMWGLDAADPRVAIAAMQAMNASVRNAVFAPAFFGTSIVCLITTVVLMRSGQRAAAVWFGISTLLIAVLGVFLTMAVNVPMNEALALIEVPAEIEDAHKIWLAYSPEWQFWNQTRTIATGLAVLCIGIAFLKMERA